MSIQAVAAVVLSLSAEQIQEFREVWWFSSTQETLAWYRGSVLTGISIRKREEDWLLVVRARQGPPNGKVKHEVCFVTADTMWGCVKIFAWSLKYNALTWKADKYPLT